ncbi:hypothetical protein JOL79_05090 [Microbispora sp. RL4-1S]|uniref:Uncharacterized protein n=1 Tax=Microbispora oryzae TaxID=2806554 RepID=A0A940WCW6_9ACTN|nr:DUF6328 family protein [Microbispora oryzae]MBP2703175.1 hypothetical protein [Microbispora oryzae]
MNDMTEPLTNPEETRKERVDRELGELLQGLRVASTGVQVLFAFLLTLPFSSGFGKIDVTALWMFYVAVASAATASICLIAPAAQHRVLFRSQLKEVMLKRANRIGVVGGVALAVSMTFSTGLVVAVSAGSWPGALIAAGVAGLSAWLWFVQPLLSLHRAPREGTSGGHARPGADSGADFDGDATGAPPSTR